MFIIFIHLISLQLYSQQGISQIKETNFQCAVVLDIYDAFVDWHTNTSWGGDMHPKSELGKVLVGAVCLANKNDTNGSATPDYQETNITENALGRNEVDLMKLVIRPRDPSLNLSGDVILRKISGDNLKVWTSPVKLTGTNVSLPRTIPTSDLPATFYVEALKPSSSIRDIAFEVEFAGNKDQVKATAVWVDLEKVYHQPEDIPDFESLGVGDCHMNQISTNQSADGSYFGYGNWEFENESELIQRMGSRILFHWNIRPSKARDLIELDGTRQRQTRNWKIDLMEPEVLLPDCKFTTNHEDFPFNRTEPQDNELPNDDRFKPMICGDFDLITEDGNFFTYDPPSLTTNGEFLSQSSFPIFWGFSNDKTNFLEWVRAAPKGYNFNPSFQGSGKLLGSRASVKFEWGAARYATKDKNFLHVKDDEDHSLNHIRVNAMGPTGDHNYYPLDYTVTSIDHSYPLATYIAAVFWNDGDIVFGLSRIEPDANGECMVEVENHIFSYPDNHVFFDLIFDDHEVEIEEINAFNNFQLNWNTFYSTNKKNELKINGHFTNLNH